MAPLNIEGLMLNTEYSSKKFSIFNVDIQFSILSRCPDFDRDDLFLDEPLGGIEPPTSSLPRKCSTTELQRLVQFKSSSFQFRISFPWTPNFYNPELIMSGRRVSNSRPIAWKAIALPIELLPLLSASRRIYFFKLCQPSFKLLLTTWAEKDSNLRTRERTDLQSVAFSHSAICPYKPRKYNP